jgi:hypothetical protein
MDLQGAAGSEHILSLSLPLLPNHCFPIIASQSLLPNHCFAITMTH